MKKQRVKKQTKIYGMIRRHKVRRKCAYCETPATARLIIFDGRGTIATCRAHRSLAKASA